MNSANCSHRQITRWLATSSAQPAVPLVTFIDKIPDKVSSWLLGLTAASHGVPLLIVGLDGKHATHGRHAYDPMQKSQKWLGFEKALRLLSSAPAVMFADGFDVLVANAPSANTLVPGRQVLFGAECNSWPKCLKLRYANHSAHQACLSRSQACFLNTGMGVAAPAAWRRLLVRLLPMMPMEDQFAVHQLYLEAPGASRVDIAVDDQSRFAVNVFQCKGAEAYQRGPPKWERCSYGAYSPSERISVAGTALHFASASAGTQRPVLLHVAGSPPGQSKEARIAPLARLISTAAAQRPNLAQQPVLLVDAFGDRLACRLAPLGDLTKVPSQQDLMAGTAVWRMH